MNTEGKPTFIEHAPIATPHGTLALKPGKPWLLTLDGVQVRYARRSTLELAIKAEAKRENGLIRSAITHRADRLLWSMDPAGHQAAGTALLSSLSSLICTLIWNGHVHRGGDPRAHQPFLSKTVPGNQVTDELAPADLPALRMTGNAPSSAELGLACLHLGLRWQQDLRRSRGWQEELVNQIVLAINPEARLTGRSHKALKHADPRRDEKAMMAISFPGLRGRALALVSRDVMGKPGSWNVNLYELRWWWSLIRTACSAWAAGMNRSEAKALELAVKLFTDMLDAKVDEAALLSDAQSLMGRTLSEREQLEVLKLAKHSDSWYTSKLSIEDRRLASKACEGEGPLEVMVHRCIFDRTLGHKRSLVMPQQLIAGMLAKLLLLSQRPEGLFEGMRGTYNPTRSIFDAAGHLEVVAQHQPLHGLPPMLAAMLSGRGLMAKLPNIQQLDRMLGDAAGEMQDRLNGGLDIPQAALMPSHELHQRLMAKVQEAGRSDLCICGQLDGRTLALRPISGSHAIAKLGEAMEHCIAGYAGAASAGQKLLFEGHEQKEDGSWKAVLAAELDVENFGVIQMNGYRDVPTSGERRQLAMAMLSRLGLTQDGGASEGQWQELPFPLERPEIRERPSEEGAQTPQDAWNFEVKAWNALREREERAGHWLAHKVIGRLASELGRCEIHGTGLVVRIGEDNADTERQLELYKAWGSSGYVKAARHLYQFEVQEHMEERASNPRSRLGRIAAEARAAGMELPPRRTLRLRAYGPQNLNGRLVMRGDTSFLYLAVERREKDGTFRLELQSGKSPEKRQRIKKAGETIEKEFSSRATELLGNLGSRPEHQAARAAVTAWYDRCLEDLALISDPGTAEWLRSQQQGSCTDPCGDFAELLAQIRWTEQGWSRYRTFEEMLEQEAAD